MAWAPDHVSVELPRCLVHRARLSPGNNVDTWFVGLALADQTLCSGPSPRGINPVRHRAVQSSGIGLRSGEDVGICRRVNLENCIVA